MAIVTNGLLSYYNALSGVGVNSWGNIAPGGVNDATLNNMTLRDGALETNGTWGSFISVPVPNELNKINSPFTMEFNLSHSNTEAYLPIFNSWVEGTEVYTTTSLGFDGLWVRFTNPTQTGTSEAWFDGVYDPNRLYHFTLVYDGALALSLYVDGVFISTATLTGEIVMNNLDYLDFGDNHGATATYKLIRLYNRALTGAEVQQNFAEGTEIGLTENELIPEPDATPPATPTGLNVTVSSNEANVSWVPVSDSDLAGYNIYADSIKQNSGLIIATSYKITGLDNGRSYNIQVTSVDTSGNESEKSLAFTATPQADEQPPVIEQPPLSDHKMHDLLVFDPYDNLLAVLSNEIGEACPFWDAPFKEVLNGGSTFEFTTVADHEDAQHIVAENQVAFMDKDGYFRLFTIKEPEYTNGADGPQIRAICEPAMLELNDDIVEDVRPYDTTAEDALGRVLVNTRWEVGQVGQLGLNSKNFYYITATKAINEIVDTWGGELRDRAEIQDNQIVGRYIDLLARRGEDTGKIWEIDKDILSISRKVLSYPKTALYGRGASLETEGGGYTRKITFSDIEWSTANGDPVDKPLGQEWVGDPTALENYGRLKKIGNVVCGGKFTGSFVKNTSYSGIANVAEIQVNEGVFVHPNGSEYNITGNVEIQTQMESGRAPNSGYIMFVGSDPSRFNLTSIRSKDFVLAHYNEQGKTWTWDTNTSYEQFSPNKNDCVVSIVNSDGTGITEIKNAVKHHRFGIYETSEQEDPAMLLLETWEALQQQTAPLENFSMDVFLLGEIAGYEHERVRLGDTTIGIDRTFSKPIEIEERVIEFEYDIADPDNTGHVVLGQHIDLYSESDRLDKVESTINDKAPIWDGKATEEEPITDGDFPNIVPDIPQNFIAQGLFNTINLKWDYDHTTFIAAYEVYGSQIQGFTPDLSNLLWRGKSSGFMHNAEDNEQWYFRMRAINTHGTTSGFTDEIQANTVKINGQSHVIPQTITNELIAEGVSADKITAGILRAITLMGVNIVGSVFESENGNFRADDTGITLKNLLAKTTLTTEGLTGWWDATGNKDYEKIFYFNEDETVSKKFRAKDEFTMGNIKIVKVDFGGNKGWAFVPADDVYANLLENHNFESGITGWKTWNSSYSLISAESFKPRGVRVYYNGGASTNYGIHIPKFAMEANKEYIVSFTLESMWNSGYKLDYIYLREYDANNTAQTIRRLPDVDLSTMPNAYGNQYGWKVKFFVSSNTPIDEATILIGQYTNGLENQGFVIREMEVRRNY